MAGNVVLITGGTGAIGEATAIGLATLGVAESAGKPGLDGHASGQIHLPR